MLTATTDSVLVPFFMSLLMFLPAILRWGLILYVVFLLIKALQKYLGTQTPSPETIAVRKSLGEAIKEHRTRCKMTQEFVAEHLNVSRQAVSKWENGTSDPSTANLLALAKLFGVSASELLEHMEE